MNEYDGTSLVVPGTLRGYRCWRLEPGSALRPGPTLYPVHANNSPAWLTRRMTATCDVVLAKMGHRAHRDQQPPAVDCSCGFYATYGHIAYRRHLPNIWNDYFNKPRRWVHGSIKASGRIILGTWGFRAQYVEVEALWGWRGRRVAKAYGVPWYPTQRTFLKHYPAHDVSELLEKT